MGFILSEAMFKKPIYTVLQMKQMGKSMHGLPTIAIERSPREEALKFKPREIKQLKHVDNNKYSAEHCRRMRELNGVGNKRKLNSSHQQHFERCMNQWKVAA